jgi:hypothetical protein
MAPNNRGNQFNNKEKPIASIGGKNFYKSDIKDNEYIQGIIEDCINKGIENVELKNKIDKLIAIEELSQSSGGNITHSTQDKAECCGIDYKEAFNRNTIEIHKLHDENIKLRKAILILTLKLYDIE